LKGEGEEEQRVKKKVCIGELVDASGKSAMLLALLLPLDILGGLRLEDISTREKRLVENKQNHS